MKDHPSHYEEAETYFSQHYKWHLHPETFQMLAEHIWITKATTMWHTAKGESEVSFVLFYDMKNGQRYQFEIDVFQALGQWYLQTLCKGEHHHASRR